MTITTEYIAIFRRSDAFCDSVSSFLKLLQVDSNIEIRSGDIHFKKLLHCHLKISAGEIAVKKQRYFQIAIIWNGDPDTTPDQLIDYQALCRSIRSATTQAGGEIEILWDDVSFYFARSAYPLIYEIENLMRKLIANFMHVHIGSDWPDQALPDTVHDAVRKNRRAADLVATQEMPEGRNKAKTSDYLHVLHRLDFIELGEFLFRPYSNITIQELYNKIQTAKSEETILALKTTIPQSNWTRYFSGLVDCSDTYLKSRWSRMYNIRCNIAHNTFVSKGDIEEIRKLISEVKPKLIDAIAKLSKITIPDSEFELVAENAAQSLNAALGEFIEQWKQLEGALEALLAKGGKQANTDKYSFANIASLSVFDSQDMADYRMLRDFRNRAVHHGAALSLEEIRASIDKTKNLLNLMKDGSLIIEIDLTDIDANTAEKSINLRVNKECTFQELLDEIYYRKMSDVVPAYTYGIRWTLLNQETNSPLQKRGAQAQRPISKLGISSKTRLRIVILPTETQRSK